MTVKNLPVTEASEEKSNQSDPQPEKDLTTDRPSPIDVKASVQQKSEPKQTTSTSMDDQTAQPTKSQKVEPKVQEPAVNQDASNTVFLKQSTQDEQTQRATETVRAQNINQRKQIQQSKRNQNTLNASFAKQADQTRQIQQVSEPKRAQSVDQAMQQTRQSQDVLNVVPFRQSQRSEQTVSKSEGQNRRENLVESVRRNVTDPNTNLSQIVSNFKPQYQKNQNVARAEEFTRSQDFQIPQASQVQFSKGSLKNVEISQKFEAKQLQSLKREFVQEKSNPSVSKIPQFNADVIESQASTIARQKMTLVAQQVEIKANNTKNSEEVATRSVSTSETASQPSIVLNATQVKVILDNLSRYVKEVSSETTQFKHLKREMPETIKVREPIKIETFKLTVAKEIKQIEQEPLQQRNEKFETTEQLKETMNHRLARKAYEQEQPAIQHVRIEQNSVDEVVVRVEQEQRAQNLQTIVETVRQMRETLTERAEVQLSPPSLGKLEIELVKQQDRLTILMRVSTPEAKQMIENSSRELASRLSSLGFKVEQIEVRMNPKIEQEHTNEEREDNQQFTQHQQQHRRKEQEGDEDDQRD
ncbi:MAG: Flagellar hook-length control protein [Thermotoga sp. 50_1627]|nr:MAG: Flagellar hook-length control protein [Thermotoga sp. 50_64]KUK24830.1 MAG: Flagellar hook-length control protein [Thermotoga sp. 50_1627]